MGFVYFSIAGDGTRVLAYIRQAVPVPQLLKTLDAFTLLKRKDIASDTGGKAQTLLSLLPAAPG